MVPALPQVMDSRLLKALNANREKAPTDLTKKPIELKLPGFTSFAMLPGFKLHYPKEDDALVAETVKFCRALSERDPARRLELIEAIQKSKPDDRVQNLLRRNIESTLESALRATEEARRLLKEAGKK